MEKDYPTSMGGYLNDPKELIKYASHKSFWDFAKDKTNPMVYCIITIDGKEFEGSFSIEIVQHTNSHDFFTVTTPDDNFDSFHGYVMEQSKYLTGKEITVSFWRYGKSRQSFSGIIGKIQNKKNAGGGYGDLLIIGYAPSILLENGKDCQSFENKTLKQIHFRSLLSIPTRS